MTKEEVRDIIRVETMETRALVSVLRRWVLNLSTVCVTLGLAILVLAVAMAVQA